MLMLFKTVCIFCCFKCFIGIVFRGLCVVIYVPESEFYMCVPSFHSRTCSNNSVSKCFLHMCDSGFRKLKQYKNIKKRSFRAQLVLSSLECEKYNSISCLYRRCHPSHKCLPIKFPSGFPKIN